MSSEFAVAVCNRYFKTEGGLLRDAVDAELQEVREVLGWAFGENSGYWSYLMHELDCPWNTEPENICTCRVERARALMGQLEIK